MKKPQKIVIIDDNSNKELGILIKKHQNDWKILRRLKAIKMRSEGEKVKDITKKLDISGDVATDWFQLYNDEGFNGLCKMKYEGRRVSEFEQHKEIIIGLIKNHIYNSYAELYAAIKDSVGEIKVGVDALRKFCKKNEIGVIRNVT